jgi:hypothetical protein
VKPSCDTVTSGFWPENHVASHDSLIHDFEIRIEALKVFEEALLFPHKAGIAIACSAMQDIP